MQKSLIHLTNNLSNLLLEFPSLVRRLERKDPQFLPLLLTWIESAEDLLSTYRIVGVAELSGLKSKILSPSYSNDFRGSLRKQQLKVAVDILYDLQECLQKTLEPHQQKVTQSRELINQLLSIVAESGAIQYKHPSPLDQFVRQIWQILNSHDQLKGGAVQLKSQFSEQDVILLIAEEIDLSRFSGRASKKQTAEALAH
jgi:hypothetical protein